MSNSVRIRKGYKVRAVDAGESLYRWRGFEREMPRDLSDRLREGRR